MGACEPTPSDELAEELSVASKKAGEKFWRMPIEEGYWELMKSNIADFVNTGSHAGGSITATLFLKQFVDEKASLGTLGYCRTCMERQDWRNRFCSLHIGRMGCQELISFRYVELTSEMT